VAAVETVGFVLESETESGGVTQMRRKRRSLMRLMVRMDWRGEGEDERI
jgi:hypothetical protein